MASIPPGESVNPAARIREIAELATTGDMQDRLYRLAAELEIQYGQLTDRMQATIGTTELDLREHIDQIVGELDTLLTQRMDTSDARQATILEFLEQLQTDVEILKGRPPGGIPDAEREAEREAGG
jgi:hypothetical protein